MNVNSLPQTPVINNWLADAASQLNKAGIVSSRLDAEIILAHSINKPRTYLHAHNDEMLGPQFIATANRNLTARLSNHPIAYIVGYKEFYGRQFIVSSDTLIPRPESEDIIEILTQILPPVTHHLPPTKLVDVGTGCGCLGITAKLEFPLLDVKLTDISKSALKIARLNADQYYVNLNILCMDLLENYFDKSNIIIANLPYVDPSWNNLQENNNEPSLALFASDHGLSVIKKLITQASDKLIHGGYLIIEADPIQHDELIRYAKQFHLKKIRSKNYVIVFICS